ncbi:MAG: pitrilysin family protein [Patescibacteria group bacterium]
MEYKKSKLKNGLQVIMSPLRETQAVTILVLLPVGSRYETEETNGISHFIEHLLFKGTKKRPTTLDLVKDIDQVGAFFNAFTGKEYTGYFIKIDAKKIELGLDILSDILFNSTFKQEEIDRERGVVIEELKMYRDNPLMYISNLFEQTLFEGNKLGWDIGGSQEVIAKVTRAQILNYYKKHYHPENMILTLAGRFNEASAKKLITNYFGQQDSQFEKTKAGFAEIKLKPQTAIRVNFKKQASEQVQLELGFPGYKYGDPRNYAATLLSVILGGNMSSRLFINVRERNGLAYFVKSDTEDYRDIGVFSIRAGVAKQNVKKTIELIVEDLNKIKAEKVDLAELQKAKDWVRGKMILGLEDSESIAQWCGDQQLYAGKIMTPQERLEKFEKVSIDDIQKIAQDIFKISKMSVAIIGPQKVDLTNLKK